MKRLLMLLILLPFSLPVHAAELVTVRLFLDLECPFSRQAWPIYRHALASHPEVGLVVQHLPLSRHPLAMPAAVATVAARAQGKEIQFIEALLGEPSPDAAGIERAAQQVGLNLETFEKARRDPAISAQVEREHQAGLAFGIRSTPSALLNGRGLAGVPPVEALERALQVAIERARRDRAELGAQADLERAGLLRHAPDFVPALDAMRDGRACQVPETTPQIRGQLGPLWKVTLQPADLAFGKESPLTAVLFLDPTHRAEVKELETLRKLQAERKDLRVVVKLLLFESRRAWKQSIPPLALWLAAAQLTSVEKTLILLEKLQTGTLDFAQWETAAQQLGLDPQTLRRTADTPATTAWLQQNAELARRIQASPGAIFINGRRWLGQAADNGLPLALNELMAAQKKPQNYEKLIANGRLLQDVELDLAPPEPLGVLNGLPALTQIGPPVVLFVDFRSPHSRAAFYMLRRLALSAEQPIRLSVASIASGAEPGVTPSGAALIAAARLGKGLEMAEALFSVQKPDDWTSIYTLLKKMKLDQTTLQKAVEAPETRETLRSVWKARQRLDMQDEPVIYLGNRLYQGPLDEARLERAVQFVRSESPMLPQP